MRATSTKRKDSKGRNLNDGEQQKKNGLYEYRYYDADNNRRSIYSWRLSQSDPVPKGKRYCEPLRDMEEEIKKDLHDEIDTFVSKDATLNERFDAFISGKTNLSETTLVNYEYNYNRYVRKTLGRRPISKINYSVIKKFYNNLITKKGMKPNSMEGVRTVFNTVFDWAIFDSIFR